jgi:hypothetical protein
MNAPHHHIFYQYVTPNGVIGVYSSAEVCNATFQIYIQDGSFQGRPQGITPTVKIQQMDFPHNYALRITHYAL